MDCKNIILLVIIVAILTGCVSSPLTESTEAPVSVEERIEAMETVLVPEPEGNQVEECQFQVVSMYVSKIDNDMDHVWEILAQIQKTETRDEYLLLQQQIDDLYMDAFLWEVPDCAGDLHASYVLALLHLSLAMEAVSNFEIEEFDYQYQMYTIANQEMNREYDALMKVVAP